MRKCLLCLCLWTLLAEAEEPLQVRLYALFSIIESKEDGKRIDEATQKILAIGNSALPFLQRRFEETGHPRYFYLLEKLKRNKNPWDKIEYFERRWEEAKALHNKGETKAAVQMAEAILTLEPSLPFQEELKRFLRGGKQLLSQKQLPLQAGIRALQSCYPLGQKIECEFSIKNTENIPVTISVGKNSGIVVEMIQCDYSPQGHYEEKSSSTVMEWETEIRLGPFEQKRFPFRWENPLSNALVYRMWKISGSVPLCRLEKEGSSSYPKILFAAQAVHSVPQDFISVTRNPAKTALWALQLGYAHHLFFASFFLTKEEKQNLIPSLIGTLESRTLIASVSFVLLQHFTKKNFASKSEWEHWWQAQNLWKGDE